MIARLAIALALCAGSALSEGARLIGEVPAVGDGLSGIEVSEDGTRFTAISDRSALLRGDILREAGVPVGVRVREQVRLTRADGRPAGDSEGIAISPAGGLFVSYEGAPPAIMRIDEKGSAAAQLPLPPGFSDLPFNNGPEALAISEDGALYTIPESAAPVPVWRLRSGRWQTIMTLDLGRGYVPVGADIGPDGNLYVLARNFVGIAFSSKLLRVGLDGQNPQTVLQTALLEHGNLEGVSVWRDAEGRLRATMIEDNNELAVQRGGLVEYLLPDPAPVDAGGASR